MAVITEQGPGLEGGLVDGLVVGVGERGEDDLTSFRRARSGPLSFGGFTGRSTNLPLKKVAGASATQKQVGRRMPNSHGETFECVQSAFRYPRC